MKKEQMKAATNAMVEWLSHPQELGKAPAKIECAGSFAGFVLLENTKWDKAQFLNDLKNEWNIEVTEDERMENEGADDVPLVFSVGNMTAAVSLMPAPIPDSEAELNAENNYMWPEAVAVAKAHKAHIVAAVLGNAPLLEKGKLFVKLLACCCRQKNATGVYTSGTVFEPRFYEDLAGLMKQGGLPIFNWIWFGLYRREQGVCCYTYGMRLFGKDEMEVLDADASPSDIRDFLSDMAAYVLENDVTLKDGETIGFSKDDKHLITRGEGVSLPELTLKISY